MHRKDFIKNSLLGCTVVLGVPMLSGCASVAMLETAETNGQINVALSQFVDKKYLKVRVKGLNYDLLVTKKDESNFVTYYMKCTHNDAGVIFDGKQFQCPLHGSSFDANGKVILGPATVNLKVYETKLLKDSINIKLS
jgi:Rieske Fe-S protein